jgi:ParB family chromosome partitioning protein
MAARKKRGNAFLSQSNQAATKALIERDREKDARDEAERSLMPLDKIKNRESDTRPIIPKHAELIAESISAIGLLQPLAVDTEGVLVAGGHRLTAIRSLSKEDRKKHFPGDLIPVRVLPYKISDDPDKALAAEVAENAVRENYTTDQIRELAARFQKAGYRVGKGRPKAGEKNMLPHLSLIIGKHIRTIQRSLNSEKSTEQEVDVNKTERQIVKLIEKALNANPNVNWNKEGKNIIKAIRTQNHNLNAQE